MCGDNEVDNKESSLARINRPDRPFQHKGMFYVYNNTTFFGQPGNTPPQPRGGGGKQQRFPKNQRENRICERKSKDLRRTYSRRRRHHHHQIENRARSPIAAPEDIHTVPSSPVCPTTPPCRRLSPIQASQQQMDIAKKVTMKQFMPRKRSVGFEYQISSRAPWLAARLLSVFGRMDSGRVRVKHIV